MRNFRRLIAALVAAAALAPATLAAQGPATITGRVTNAQGQPEAAVLVRIESLNVGASTGADGNYRLVIPGERIRAGQSVTVTATRTGLSPVSRTVTLSPGATLTQNFQMATSVLLLEDVVVTGVAAPTSRARVPFEVASVSQEDLVVPATTAAGAIQGKVAGARVVQGSGQPGSSPSVLLRGPTSINATGRTQDPLYIVDGVILGSGGLEDIDPQDIESIEVVKGAAAASLYGSRAASGVVQIRTRRGRDLSGQNRTRYTVRAEGGESSIEHQIDIAQYHPWRMNAAKTRFVRSNGTEYDWNSAPTTQALAGSGPFTTFQVNPWPGTTYDQVDRFFDPGGFRQGYAGVEGSSGRTNFFASATMLDNAGVLVGHEGYNRNTFRLNLDHGIGDKVQLSASGNYVNSTADVVNASGSGSPFFNLTFMVPVVDLTARDSTGSLIVTGDPQNRNEYPNPLYEVENRETSQNDERFLGSFQMVYSPMTWLRLDGQVSYDRTNSSQTDLFPYGYRTKLPNAALNRGNLTEFNSIADALNGSLTATLDRSFGDLETRTQVRYLYEEQDYSQFQASGAAFAAEGVETLSATTTQKAVTSYGEEVRAEGFFGLANLSFRDRYILDALVRRDGSSLFGDEERWQTYYRVSGAWRVAEEPWFNVPSVTDFKVHASLGTAGNRPSFAAQYETNSIAGGTVTPNILGNPDLKPEHVTEREVGLNLGLMDRFNLTLNYAASTAEDQLLLVPFASYRGVSAQWTNAGTLESNTIEASLEANLIQRGNLNWSARLNWDRTRQEITELDVPCYSWGNPNLQNVENVFFNCPGVELGTFFGRRWAESCTDLPAAMQNRCGEFDVNDDGYLVYVGAGNTYRSGVGADGQIGTADDLWGSRGAGDMSNYNWGIPFSAIGTDPFTGGLTNYFALGSAQPDYNFSFSNSLNWGGLSLYGLLDASIGYEVYNQTRQWAMFRNRSGENDQVGKAPEEMKPVGYYGILYNAATVNSEFVEDASFVKLREVALRYTFGADRLAALRAGGFDHVTLGVIGRNLKTWTDYLGYDPEVGFAGSTGGSAVLSRFDAFGYPNFRTVSLSVEVGF
ncbi:SusC/RagA family TonB-linked outer membrane protein [Longimicrobium sp.]|uniref:SusC/RagA family TonB-linked outer membrane protein n=1 Tax=Longimicrobium sp. TaxID=2029185 RepID=UPI002E316BEF|nr:SusC/RagA family TonB-linked outer membrane protein [Longimicrobium sp.]HEX6040094.1 SusC/RagA family TonB-linked outer membrane protein [Longimicrobium sp.]